MVEGEQNIYYETVDSKHTTNWRERERERERVRVRE